jgi:hypothetical protein
VVIQCPAYELQRALQYGKNEIKRNASYMQRGSNGTGCNNFSEEDVKIFYDDEGNAIDYEMPSTDPEIILDFTLIAGLIKYGMDPQNLFIGTHDTVEQGGEWGKIRQGFDSQLQAISQSNRKLFPPDPINVDGKSYEIAAVTVCNNLTCVSNSGKTTIDPLPLIMK